MMSGTNPSITALTGGGFEVAFQANTTSLWTVGDGGDKDWGLGMMKGTSPAIAPCPAAASTSASRPTPARSGRPAPTGTGR